MMVGRVFLQVFLVLTGACQFGHGVGGFTTNFIHSQRPLALNILHMEPAAQVEGADDIWPGLEVYSRSENGRQGKEFPLLFHCVCVIGVLYSEHQAQLLPAPPPHTTFHHQGFSFYHSSWRTDRRSRRSRLNKNTISSKLDTRLSLGLGSCGRKLNP